MNHLLALDPAKLKAMGYRRISNRHRIIARIDEPQWVQIMAEELRRAPADFYVPGDKLPAANWDDYYRRVISRDRVSDIPESVFRQIPLSGDDQCGFKELP